MRTNQATSRKLARLALPGLLCVALSFGGVGTANALVVNWVDGTSFWDVLTNWSSGLLPSATDDVVINVGGVPTITHSTGNTTIHTLSISQPATVVVTNASSLTVTNGGTNAGTFSADGGTLNLFGGTVTNAGGMIEAGNASTVLLSGATISGGTLATDASSRIYMQTHSVLQNLTNTGQVVMLNNNYSGFFDTASRLEGTITNNGTLLLNSTGQTTELRIVGDVTLAGTGSLIMSDNANNLVDGNSSGLEVLTNAASHTIQGSGQLGNNFMGLSNQGLILANQPTALVIDLNDTIGLTRMNNGILRADGGQLTVQNTVLTNGGIIEGRHGSHVLLSGATISGGTLATDASSRIYMQTHSVLQNLTITGQVVMLNNNYSGFFDTASRLEGTITNNGTLLLNSTGQTTELRIVGDVTLAGTGSLIMSDNANNLVDGNSSGLEVLTNAAGHTIQGSGQLGNNFMGLSNQGIILTSNPANALIVDLKDGATIRANAGTLRAGGGQLILQNTALDNTGGVIEAVSNNVLLSGSTVTGGTLQTVGGQIQMQGASRLTNLTNIGQVVMLNNNYSGFFDTASRLEGTITNNGTLLLNSTGQTTELRIVGDVTLAGTGSLIMSDNANNHVYGNSSGLEVLTNSAGHTIQGSGNIGYNFMVMTNHGLIHANQPTALIIDPSNCVGCGLTNTGTLRAAAGSTLTVTDSLTNFSGSTLSGGTYEVYGTAGQAGTMRLANANIVTNAATILLDGPNSNLLRHDTGTNALANFAANAAAGSFTIQNGRDFATTGLLINAGNVTVGPASTLTVGSGANFVQTAGVTTVNGTLAAALADIQGGTLKGGGTASGNVSNNAGVIEPGNNLPGTLTVQGGFAQLAGGVLNIEIDGLSSFDLLAVGGDARLGGTLSVAKLANYNPHVGDSFQVMTFADHGGTIFDNVSYSDFGAGVLFGVVYNPTNVTLQVAAVPEAETWAMLLAGIGLIGFRLRGGRLTRDRAVLH